MLPCSDPRGSLFCFGIIGGWDCCCCCCCTVFMTENEADDCIWLHNVSKLLDECSLAKKLLFDVRPNVIRKWVGFRPTHVTATKWQFVAVTDAGDASIDDFRFTDGNLISNSVFMDAAIRMHWLSKWVTSANGRLKISSFVEIDSVHAHIWVEKFFVWIVLLVLITYDWYVKENKQITNTLVVFHLL